MASNECRMASKCKMVGATDPYTLYITRANIDCADVPIRFVQLVEPGTVGSFAIAVHQHQVKASGQRRQHARLGVWIRPPRFIVNTTHNNSFYHELLD